MFTVYYFKLYNIYKIILLYSYFSQNYLLMLNIVYRLISIVGSQYIIMRIITLKRDQPETVSKRFQFLRHLNINKHK